MPKPNEGETEKEFISRCIPMVMDEGTAEDNEQAAAVCYSMWREHMGEKTLEFVVPPGYNNDQFRLDELKIGARNNARDSERLQQIHDLAVENGAACPEKPEVVQVPMMEMMSITPDDLMYQGAEVKALGEGKVGGYLVRYGNPKDTDAEQEFFNAKTELGVTDGGTVPVFYNHGMDDQVKARRIGRGEMKFDDVGAWVEAQLELRDEYEKAIYEMAEAGKLGWSSGAAGHLVERERVGKATWIKTWIIAEASLTPTPAEFRNAAVPIKSLLPADMAQLPAAEAAGAALKATQPQLADEQPNSNTGEIEMNENIDVQAIAKAAAEEAVKAFAASLPAEHTAGYAGVTPGGDEADRALVGNPFKSFGEFMLAVRDAANGDEDKRLKPLKEEGMYSLDAPMPKGIKVSGLNEAIPSQGGYLTQPTYLSGILERMYSTGQIMGRVNYINLGPNSNSVIVPGIDETSRADGSRYGGVQGYWLAEAATKTSSKPKFSQIQLFLHKVAALVYSTDELLADVSALDSWLMSRVPQELVFKAEDAYYNGDGVGKPLGVMASPALVTVTRDTGAKVLASDIFAMWARFWMGSRTSGSACWMVGPDTETQLHQLYLQTGIAFPFFTIDAQGVSRLLGLPVVVNEYSPALNTTGDIGLFDWSQYYATRKGGIEAASSIHVSFTTDETAFRFVYRTDGEGSWNSALTMKNASAGTLSPFVVLGSAT